MIYPLASIVIGLFFWLGGIFLALPASLALTPVYPVQKVLDNRVIRLYEAPPAFLGAAICGFNVERPAFLLLEKHEGVLCNEDRTPVNNGIWDDEKKELVVRKAPVDIHETGIGNTYDTLRLQKE
ncbi:hypothetical protein [Filimonas lacunae]|nr:hypothetical protein [Filimonas lacunae]